MFGLNYRKHFEHFEKSCIEITTKAVYRNYPMDFSILSDFNEEDLVGMMDIGEKYSHMGSYYLPEILPPLRIRLHGQVRLFMLQNMLSRTKDMKKGFL